MQNTEINKAVLWNPWHGCFFIEEAGEWRDGVNIGKWNLNDQIAKAEEIQHELEEQYGVTSKRCISPGAVK